MGDYYYEAAVWRSKARVCEDGSLRLPVLSLPTVDQERLGRFELDVDSKKGWL